jgi:hypothetical protein
VVQYGVVYRNLDGYPRQRRDRSTAQFGCHVLDRGYLQLAAHAADAAGVRETHGFRPTRTPRDLLGTRSHQQLRCYLDYFFCCSCSGEAYAFTPPEIGT